MHPGLQVYEILDPVVSYLYSSYGNRHDVLSLALTCQVFKDVALNTLWHTQNALINLIKTLPPHCWSDWRSTRVPGRRLDIVPDRLPSQRQFAVFTSYARRIRKITYVSHAIFEPECQDLAAVRFLWEYAHKKHWLDGPLFSNLYRLEFLKISNAINYLDMFLETKSISLSFAWAEPHPSIVDLFPIIQKKALNMTELDLGTITSNLERVECPSLSNLVCEMNDLRSLSCAERMLTTKAIQHLSTLPYLRILQTANTSKTILESIPQDDRSKTFFSELQDLTIYEDNLGVLAKLLKRIGPLQLRHLAIHMCAEEVPSDNDLHQLLDALNTSSSRHSNIERLILKFDYRKSDRPLGFGGFEINRSIDRPKVTIDCGSTLTPLLESRGLTVLELDVPYEFHLGDSNITFMADAWVDLRRLQLGSVAAPLLKELPSSVTYDGLLYLLRKCRNLEYLVLAFDGASRVPSVDEVSEECVNRKITYLDVGNSTIGSNSPSLVAIFLKNILPNVCGIRSGLKEWETVVSMTRIKPRAGKNLKKKKRVRK